MNKKPLKILVYPKATNPYQDLLYSNKAITENCEIKYINLAITKLLSLNLLLFPGRLLLYRLKGYSIFHLHWLYEFQAPPLRGYFIRLFFTIYVIFLTLLIKICGIKFVWTLHEILPNEPEFIDDVLIRKYISKISNAKIVLSNEALKNAKKYGFSIDNTNMLPHGNYISSYKNELSKEQARRNLKLNNKDFVYLFFGLIKQYKGVDDLLSAFEKLLKSESENIHLIIAGACEDPAIKKKILSYKDKYTKSLTIKLTHIKDNDVQLYFNASDVVVLPFKTNTTSGSSLLAQSFGKPLIAPLIGSIKDLPKNTGLFYEPDNRNGLKDAMQESLKDKSRLVQSGRNAYKHALSFSWGEISKKVLQIYRNV